MEHIREYLLSVTAVALIGGVIRSMTGDKGLVQLLCGIFLLLTVIRPVSDFSIRELPFDLRDLKQDAEAVVSDGEDYAQAAMERHIKEQCQAYILDKAKVYDSSVTADFILDDSLMPVGCIIRGELSAYAREQLSEFLENDLGISREAQQWVP